jgi:hypothetical protein
MISLRTLPARGARSSFRAQCARLTGTSVTTSAQPLSRSVSFLITSSNPKTKLSAHSKPTNLSTLPLTLASSSRLYSSKSAADEIIEQIQDQYFTARDEFEIATEETEKKTTYAEGDRAAAREELDKLKAMFEEAINGENGEEVKNRIGQRIRELDNAVVNLEKSAMEH